MWVLKLIDCHLSLTLMGEGFILLTNGCGFMGGSVPTPFWHVKKFTLAYDMNLKLYR